MKRTLRPGRGGLYELQLQTDVLLYKQHYIISGIKGSKEFISKAFAFIFLVDLAYLWFEWVLNASYTNQRQVRDHIIYIIPVRSGIIDNGEVPAQLTCAIIF